MERILIILVGVGLVFNALTFLTVAHYFVSSRGAALAAPAGENRSGTRAPEASATAETQRRLQSLETTLSSLSKKIDGLASRSVAQSGFNASGRASRSRSGMPRRSTAGAAQGEEAEAEDPDGQQPPGEALRKSEPGRPVPPAAGSAITEVPKAAPGGVPEGTGGQPAHSNGEAPAPAGKDANGQAGGENGGAEVAPGGGPAPAGGAPAGGAEGAAGDGGGA
jgi:Na+-transporting methylmalonyl-CoA/oxaloacetate decarboxylase gamma subunit